MNRGVLIGASAYVLWGLSPIYWRLVDDVGSLDVVLARTVATAFLLLALHVGGRTFTRMRSHIADRRAAGMFVLSATLLGGNWLIFVWAVTNERVIETSLGYFINPLLSVVLGVLVLGERLRVGSMVAVAIAAVGVMILTIDVGSLPWVSLSLAASFAAYGLIRKTSPAGSLDGLTLEMLALVPIALVALAIRAAMGDGIAGVSVPGRDLWLLGAGVMTGAPLLLFANAARRIELWLVGMLQFIAPTLQFILGAVVWNEPWSGGQVVGFVFIWSALGVFVVDQVRSARGQVMMSSASRSRI
ncbi:MAG: EamA family transporter RarD [Acidimicrobiales bacterium]|nr:EamA family transporter RarD [Acidimicrobiales bacterium]